MPPHIQPNDFVKNVLGLGGEEEEGWGVWGAWRGWGFLDGVEGGWGECGVLNISPGLTVHISESMTGILWLVLWGLVFWDWYSEVGIPGLVLWDWYSGVGSLGLVF